MVNLEQLLHMLEIRTQEAETRYDAACRGGGKLFRRWFKSREREAAFGRLIELHAIRAYVIANSAPDQAPDNTVPEPELPPPMKAVRRTIRFG